MLEASSRVRERSVAMRESSNVSYASNSSMRVGVMVSMSSRSFIANHLAPMQNVGLSLF